MKREFFNKFKYDIVLINNMALETDVLVAISLAAVAKTVIFIVVIYFFVGRNERKKSHEDKSYA
jgi:hypothetical protein